MSNNGTSRIYLTVTCADLSSFLNDISNNGISVYDLSGKDILTASFCIKESDWKQFSKLVRQRGVDCTVLKRKGMKRSVMPWLKRPVLMLGFIFMFFLTTYIPQKILFVQVEGNETVPAWLILDRAEQCGVAFGADRKALRNEQVKNRLLSEIPQLRWAGLNTKGCVAIIHVKERQSYILPDQEEKSVSSLVAKRDGVIISYTATKGTVKCAVGQAVKEGQVLISGYTDCGINIRAQNACGEVYAQTLRNLRVVAPTKYSSVAETKTKEQNFSLILGKKRINFYKDSGNLYAGCDKIYEEYYITLPGGFQLPVGICRETVTVQQLCVKQVDGSGEICNFAKDYLLKQMISGVIDSEISGSSQREELLLFEGKYICREMIAKVHSEEILFANGKDDGKKR